MIMKDINNKIRELIESAYTEGYKDGKSLEYDLGLNDAWECARKMETMLFNDPQFEECFGKGASYHTVMRNLTPSEAMAKIKEYEEKQKSAEDAEIKVGDEVIYCGGGAHDGSVGVVIGAEKDWREVRFKTSWNCVGVYKDTLTKTGRHFPQIEEVLEQLKGEEGC